MTLDLRGRQPDPAAPHSPVRLDPITLDAVAVGLAAGLREVPGRIRPSTERRWWRVVATAEFDAWLIDWPPGTFVEPHDHAGSAAALVVVRGELEEVTWPSDRPITATLSGAEVRRIPRRSTHRIANVGDRPATSVHVYSPPLEAMTFHRPGGSEHVAVAPESTVWSLEGW